MRPRVAATLVALPLVAAGTTAAITQRSSIRANGAPPPAARACDRIASPAGAEHVRGTLRGVRALVRRLRPGQTGCLRGGRYQEDLTISASGITLRSYPGERAEIVGRLWIRRQAHDTVLSGLRLNGRNEERLPSPTVNGDRITFVNDDVTNDRTAICFNIGSSRYGRASGTVIRNSRIHDCGVLPARNKNHGIYVAAADDTRIVGNLIYRNADRGIQLYPDARRTVIVGNVIDGNGEGIIFSGEGGVASRDTLVQYNVISNSRVRANVESYYPPGSRVGTGNVVSDNCLFGGRGAMDADAAGFSASANVYADPQYADPARGDYRVAPTSPCAALLRAGLAAAR